MGVNIEKLKKEYKKVQQKTEGGPFWNPKVGDNRIRILPPVGKMGQDFYKEGAIHFNVGPDNSAVLCPALTPNKKGRVSSHCPICELVASLYKSDNPGDIKLAKSLKARSKFWMNILDMNDKARGPQVFGAGILIYKLLLSYFTDPDYGDMSDLREGRDIIITRSGSGIIDTSYEVRPRPKATPIKKSLIKNAPDLSTWSKLIPLSIDEIEELLESVLEEEEEEEKRGRGRKRKQVDDVDVDDSEFDEDEEEDEEEEDELEDDEEDDEDEEEDEDEEDEDEEEEDDDDDDGEEEEDDEEEEEPPKPRKKTKKSKSKSKRR